LSVLGPEQLHGEWDVVMDKNYSTTLRCLEEDSEAFVMNRPDFMRLFKTNEEAWKIMQANAMDKERQLMKTCYNFVNISQKTPNPAEKNLFTYSE